ARILAKPSEYVAQQAVQPSQTPALANGELVSRPVVMRSFAVASGSSYSIMPGGLTRVGVSTSNRHVTSQTGALSKDTWILASEPESALTLRSADETTIGGHNVDAELPSRVIENLYWFGRYAERAESGLRLLRTIFEQLNGIEPLPQECYNTLLLAATDVTHTQPGFYDKEVDFLNPESELLDIIINADRSGSIAACLQAMLHSSDGVKELLSSDMHRLSTDVRDGLEQLSGALKQGLHSAPEEALDPIVTTLLALSGLSQESMVRNRAWIFMEIGRRLERGVQTVQLLSAMLTQPLASDPTLMLHPTLKSLESAITYRRRYQGKYNIANGLELLLLEKNNPRSVYFQLNSLRNHLEVLGEEISGQGLSDASRAILKTSNALLLAELDQLATIDANTGRREHLSQLLQQIAGWLEATSIAVSDRYFDHTGGPHPMQINSHRVNP
ncbi:MAG: alpha-E domain-containing protein, partial [Spongiibacteraceae bacterium]